MLCRLFIILFACWHTHILKNENLLLNQDEYKKDYNYNYKDLHYCFSFITVKF